MRLLASTFVLASVVCAFDEYVEDVEELSPPKYLASFLLSLNAALASQPVASRSGPRGQLAANSKAERRVAAPAMILDQMKQAADELKGAAAEQIIAKKVEEKLTKAKEKYDIPEKYEGVMASLFTSYMTQVYKAGKDTDVFEGLLTQLFKRVLEQFKEPYKFEPYHEALREPYDYYALGKDFVSGVVDEENSVVMGQDAVAKMQEQLKNGENVVLFANHQSEADPQFLSVLLDPVAPGLAESTIFVAGDRVTTDLFAQPFSMGRNLLCIFSKKHIENPPEQKAEKSRHNKKVMMAMKKLFNEGGKVIWVAPSGGRDRKNLDTDRYQVAPFDSKSVEMFRLMSDKAKVKTHFYPLSMLTSTIAPPPDAVGGTIGEFRAVAYAPAALYFGDEVNVDEFAEGCVVQNFPEGCESVGAREQLRDKFSEHVHDIVQENYLSLEAALEGKIKSKPKV
jgi:glycerol-3-phosphate O-acyltransferase